MPSTQRRDAHAARHAHGMPKDVFAPRCHTIYRLCRRTAAMLRTPAARSAARCRRYRGARRADSARASRHAARYASHAAPRCASAIYARVCAILFYIDMLRYAVVALCHHDDARNMSPAAPRHAPCAVVVIYAAHAISRHGAASQPVTLRQERLLLVHVHSIILPS